MVIWQTGDLISYRKKGNDMKDYEKKMGITRTGDQTYREKIMGIGQMGDLIWYKKRCSNMKDYEKKIDIRQTGD